MSDLNVLITSAAFALFIGLVTSALQLGGVINVNLARVLLTFAWLVAILGVCGSMQNAPTKHLAIAAVATAIPVGIGLIVLERWMSQHVSSKNAPSKPSDVIKSPPKPLPNLRFVRAGVEHINLLDGIGRKIKTASEQSEVGAVAVFESEFADTEVRATIAFNDSGNTQVDRGLWLYEKTHVAKLKAGSRKELVLGYHNPQIGFVCVENDYERDREIKHKLLRGQELIAEVRLLSTKPVEAERHRFKIVVEPSFSIEKIVDESETFSKTDPVQHSFDVMSADQVPIGRTVVHQDNADIRQTFRRTAANEGQIESFDPKSGKLVLSIKVGVFSGPQVIEYVDLDFWTITVDGQRVTELPNVPNFRFLVHPPTKTIEMRTS